MEGVDGSMYGWLNGTRREISSGRLRCAEMMRCSRGRRKNEEKGEETG